MKKRVVVDRNIPYLEGLEKMFDIVRLAPGDITPEAVRDADALITRTRTRCDSALLDGSKCRFVATATIGTDHIDFDYCRSHGITVVSAPGCNAPAVAQYVFASVLRLVDRPLESYTMGIVGVGHVGSIVEKWAHCLGMKVKVCDPPRRDAEGDPRFVSLDEIAATCDIVTFHTPHTLDGLYPTHHLAGKEFFEAVRHCDILVNSARGPIVDTLALISAIDGGKIGHAVIDCWEGEPDISLPLLERVDIATPHIAGYSIEGKKRASHAVADALCRYFGLEWTGESGVAPGAIAEVTPQMITDSYDPMTDTAALRASVADFEALRNHYALRHEVGA